MDEERLISLEKKIDTLLAAFEKFGPLLDRLLAGKSILGGLAGSRPPRNPFGKAPHG